MAAPERLVERLLQFGDDEYSLLYQISEEVRYEMGRSNLGSVATILRALCEPASEVAQAVAEELWGDGDSPANVRPAEQLESWDPAGFWSLIEELTEVPRTSVEKILKEIVRSGDTFVAREAISELARLETDDGQFLLRLLADPCRHIQMSAAWAVRSLDLTESDLDHQDGLRALEILVEGCDCGPHLQNPHLPFASSRERLTCEICSEHPGWSQPLAWSVAAYAYNRLWDWNYGELGESNPPAIPAVNDEWADTVQVRRAYQNLVETAPNVAPIDEVLSNSEDLAACFLIPLARAAASFDDSHLVNDGHVVLCLLDALNLAEPQTAVEILAALGKIGDRRAVEWLIDLLADRREVEVREATVRALGELGDWEAAELLEWVSKKKGESKRVRQAAREALIRLAELGPDTREPDHWGYYTASLDDYYEATSDAAYTAPDSCSFEISSDE